ncbi:pyridoxamine 5'-phosphate oxidase family protein [Jatrophihabitans sp. DSM 45814]
MASTENSATEESSGFSSEFRAFWTERHLASLTTQRPDHSPHVVPVGVTFDFERRIGRVICSASSRKARNVSAANARVAGSARLAVCQFDGRRWSTLEGVAIVRADQAAVLEAERRYAERYRQPRPNPTRVVIEFEVDRVLGLT